MLLLVFVVITVIAVGVFYTKTKKKSTSSPSVVTPPVVEVPVQAPVTTQPAPTTPVATQPPPVVTPTPTPVYVTTSIVLPTPPNIPNDPGHGLWMPPGTTGRVVADPSGPPSDLRIVSYVPGCLNGNSANNSATGCAANAWVSGVLTGTTKNIKFALGEGRQLMVRYRPSTKVVTRASGISVTSSTGGRCPVNVRVWLTPDPVASYEDVDPMWRDEIHEGATNPHIFFSEKHCVIDKTVPFYYLGIQYFEPEQVRFQVIEATDILF